MRASDQTLTKRLIWHLREARPPEAKGKRKVSLDRWVFGLAALVVIAFLA